MSGGLPAALGAPVLVDAHAHCHACFEPRRFLHGAERNVRRAAAELGLAAGAVGLLVLTEGEGEHDFARVQRGAGGDSEWRIAPTAEEGSVLAVRDGRVRLVLAAGRQIRTAEALEVLALGRVEIDAEGRPVVEVVEAVRTAGALPVVPWGFGKWWLGRGRLLRRLIDAQDPAVFFLGDNGGRPRVFGRPPLLARAERRGFRDLPGSDPLPFPGESERAGSRGFLLDGTLEPARPVETLLQKLADPSFRPAGYGTGSALLPFLRHQAALRLRRRGTRRSR